MYYYKLIIKIFLLLNYNYKNCHVEYFIMDNPIVLWWFIPNFWFILYWRLYLNTTFGIDHITLWVNWKIYYLPCVVGTSLQHNLYIVLHLSLCFNQKTVSESATSVKRGKGHNKPSRVVHKKEVVKLEKV